MDIHDDYEPECPICNGLGFTVGFGNSHVDCVCFEEFKKIMERGPDISPPNKEATE